MTYANSTGAKSTSHQRWLLWCTGILLLGAALRLIALPDLPPGLAQDEVLDADIASFIRAGEHALFFRHGYGHEPLYHYWAVPFQVLLSDNVLSIRLPAVALGMLLIALVLRWARRDFGTTVALVAGFGLAVSWWPIIFSRIGLRPIMEPVILVCAVLFWPRNPARPPKHNLLLAVVAGGFLGLTLYTYTGARVLFALPAIFAAYCWLMSWVSSRRSRAAGPYDLSIQTSASKPAHAYRQQAVYATLALAVMVLVALPLFLTLRADPTLQQRVDQLSGPLDALQQGEMGPIAATSIATLGYFGLTGDPRWTYSLPNRPLFEPLAALLFLGGLGLAAWRWRNPIYAFLLIWLAVALVPSMVTPDAPSSVRLVGAMPVYFMLPGLAVAAILTWADRRKARFPVAFIAVSVGLGAIALLAVGRTLNDGFVKWPAALDTRLKYQTVLRDISRDSRFGAVAPVVADSFYEPIDASSLIRNYNGDIQPRWIQSGTAVSGALVWPDWRGGTGLNESILFVPEFAPLDPELLERAAVTIEPDRSVGQPSYATYNLPYPPAPSGSSTVFSDGGQDLVALQAILGPAGDSADRDSGQLVLYSDWEVLGALPSDLAIFIHLVDPSGAVVAQFDGLDAAAETLFPGDRVLQKHVLSLPDSLSDEPLALRLGLYQRSDNSRLLTAEGTEAVNVGACQVQASLDSAVRVSCDLPANW